MILNMSNIGKNGVRRLGDRFEVNHGLVEKMLGHIASRACSRIYAMAMVEVVVDMCMDQARVSTAMDVMLLSRGSPECAGVDGARRGR